MSEQTRSHPFSGPGPHDPRGRAEPVLRLLADVSAAMAESLDEDRSLANVGRLIVPVFADWCLVDAVCAKDGPRRVEVVGRPEADPAALQALRTWGGQTGLVDRHPYTRALREGRALLWPDLPPELLSGPDASALLQARIRSMICAPLVARGRTLGVLTFALQAERRPYGPSELATAEQIAYRAALSLDNARLVHEAQEKSKRAEEASRAKDEFLAMLGHELRNPLAPILTALHLLRMKGDGPPAREHTVIERQVKHLVTLVDDLLDVSRVTSGRLQLRRRLINLRDVIGRAVEMGLPLIEQRGHRLIAEVAPDLIVDGDEHRLAQVVANLLTNAAKYTDPGGEIVCTAATADGGVLIQVRDNGRGIGPALLPRVFDLFVQSTRTIDRAEGGLGLGLAIVRSLVQLHGGRVSADSDGPGKGSVFSVWLPAATGRLRGAANRAWVNCDGEPSATTDDAGAHRVLIVDDNRDLAEALAHHLSASGYQVCVANDGVRALELARDFRPAVAVLDVGLPVMDGRELARHLLGTLSPAPLLVAMTGYGQDADLDACRAAGFARRLKKPVRPADVLAVTAELLHAAGRPRQDGIDEVT